MSNNAKKAVTLNFDSFTLPFMESPSTDEEEEDFSSYDAVERMQDALPSPAIELGVIDDEVNNWCSWKIEDYYYLLPWKTDAFDWALIRISWDDNWGRYQWESCGRISGITDKWKAVKVLLKELFEDQYGFDLKDEKRSGYRDFIDNCGR